MLRVNRQRPTCQPQHRLGGSVTEIATGIGAVIENIVMAVHLTLTVIMPTVIVPILGTASMTGNAHDPLMSQRVPHLPTAASISFSSRGLEIAPGSTYSREVSHAQH